MAAHPAVPGRRPMGALAGESEHDLVLGTLLALEQDTETNLGWNTEPALFLIAADPDAGRVTIDLIPPERWAAEDAEEPETALLDFARRLRGPEAVTTRPFADMPEGRCAFAFLAEAWQRRAAGASVTGTEHAAMVEVRSVAACDVGGRRYLVERERGLPATSRTPAADAPGAGRDPIPTALWLLTAALAGGRFEL